MQNPVVTITMENGGVITAELFPEAAPNTVRNFISLARKGFYDGLTFHRVIPGFVIQGGCPLGTGTGNPGYKIRGEFRLNRFNNPIRQPGAPSPWPAAPIPTPPAASSSSCRRTPRTWTASTPPSAASLRASTWWTPSPAWKPTSSTSPSPPRSSGASRWRPLGSNTRNRRNSESKLA